MELVVSHAFMKNTIAIVDVDGVLKRETKVLPGVPELFAALHKNDIRSVLLSNGSRARGVDLQTNLAKWGVQNEHQPHALSSADVTGSYIMKNDGHKPVNAFIVGEQGIRDAMHVRGAKEVNDWWDGKKWKELPTHVVVGFDKQVGYQTLSPAWNAIKQGSKFIATNGDESFRNEEGIELPANGANIRFLSGAGKPQAVIGKPSLHMPEAAFTSMNVTKDNSRIVVIGDTFEQDMQLADALKEAGYEVEKWMVLSGVVQTKDLSRNDPVDEVFRDITDIPTFLQK